MSICLWQISQIQTRLFNVVGPGLISTSPAIVSSSASHPAGPHGRHAKNDGKSGTHCWGREGSTQFAHQFLFAVTAPPLVGCVVWSQPSAFNSILHTFLHPVLITCPYQLSLPLLMKVVIGSTPTSLLNSLFVFHGDTTHPSNHLHLCSFKL